ncbi:MAG: class I SAM-dependent methyltransferase [Lachnospiraceae bacterium]|nr:class I SAM-dependent methyltransferase [Lachnospiraceae bacterium]
MNEVNKTLYIPLYGKANVSKKGIILKDVKAELIWEKEGFALHGKAKSKWLTYYMGMRSATFDRWVNKQIADLPEATILHIGCGMDSRIERIGAMQNVWYDIDFPDVIQERKRYYKENMNYHMIEADARETVWIERIPEKETAVVIMEGVSMYFTTQELEKLLQALCTHFQHIHLLMDAYTDFAAKASKYKNPINDVGVTMVYGLDEPRSIEKQTGLIFLQELNMTPMEMIRELKGFERFFFKIMFGGKAAKKMYRLYEYASEKA